MNVWYHGAANTEIYRYMKQAAKKQINLGWSNQVKEQISKRGLECGRREGM